MDNPEQTTAASEQKTRFAALYLAAVVAIVVILPLQSHGDPYFYVLALAGVAAGVAWLVVRQRPERQGPALFRGVALVLALVGLGGLGLHMIAGQTGGMVREIADTGRFAIQAGAYACAGLLGLLGSIQFAADD